MEPNNKKIIMDIVPKSALEAGRGEKSSFGSEKNKRDDNDFLKKLRETRGESKEKKVYNLSDIFTGNRVKKEQISSASFSSHFFGRKTLIIFGVLILFAASFAFYILTPAMLAIIKITPISKIVSVSAFLKASESGGDISLSFVKIKQEKEEKIPATGAVNVFKKASGKIVVYNAFSASSQTLIKSTRFETPDKKIFIINSAVVVPGMKTMSGKIIPGSVEALVYAEKAGDEYNIDLSDFTIPGFKGTAKYGKFYARSKTLLTGGYKGIAPKVSDADVKAAEKKLKEELEQEIISKIESKSNKNSVLLKDALVTNFSSLTAPYKDDPKFAIVHGIVEISIPVLKKDDIFKYLVKKYLNNNELTYYIKNFDSLNLKTAKNISLGNISEQDAVKETTIKIEGNAIFLSRIDEEKLKSELVLEKNVSNVFKTHPEIENAKIVLSPFLKKILPKNPAKIKINIEE